MLAVVKLAKGLTRLVVMFARAELSVGIWRVAMLATVKLASGLTRLVVTLATVKFIDGT